MNNHPIPVVRLIVPDAQGRVLILRRQHTRHAPGAWCLPGGKVDHGEAVLAAVERELMEETGLRCRSARPLFYQDGLPPAPGAMHCINLVFECAAEGEVHLNEESGAHAWIGPADLGRCELAFLGNEALERYWDGTDRHGS